MQSLHMLGIHSKQAQLYHCNRCLVAAVESRKPQLNTTMQYRKLKHSPHARACILPAGAET
jgi:hypothetical protein